jgi:hypothetical protein
MIKQHPVIPPSELVEQWYDAIDDKSTSWKQQMATSAAQWGADQELEACRMEIIDGAGLFYIDETSDRVRLAEDIWTARRPKPPTLKEQALLALSHLLDGAAHSMDTTEPAHYIRLALEQLPE